jgi:hypothetical protein
MKPKKSKATRRRETVAERKVRLFNEGLARGVDDGPEFGAGRESTKLAGRDVCAHMLREPDGSFVLCEFLPDNEGADMRFSAVAPEDAARVALEWAVDGKAVRDLGANAEAFGIAAADLPGLVAARVREILAGVGGTAGQNGAHA